MVRIVFEVTKRDAGVELKAHQTLDVECPALEAFLSKEHYGGGPDDDDFVHYRVIGAERR